MKSEAAPQSRAPMPKARSIASYQNSGSALIGAVAKMMYRRWVDLEPMTIDATRKTAATQAIWDLAPATAIVSLRVGPGQ